MKGTPVSTRPPVRAHDKRIACEEEFSDSEDEGEGGRRNAASFKKVKRAKTEGDKEGEEKEKKGEEETKGIYSFFLFSISISQRSCRFCCSLCVTLPARRRQVHRLRVGSGCSYFSNLFLSEVKEEEKVPEEEKMDTSK